MRRRVGGARATRLLALEVTSTQLSYAVLEGQEHLVEWGGHSITGDVSAFLPRLSREVERYRPDALVVEDPALSRKGQRVRDRLAWAEEWANEAGIACCAVPAESFRDYALSFGATKSGLAASVARLFPELASQVPKPKEIWQSEPKRLGVFVAVARALWFYEHKTGRGNGCAFA
jgi:hypothetical protein